MVDLKHVGPGNRWEVNLGDATVFVGDYRDAYYCFVVYTIFPKVEAETYIATTL